jgi:HAMP domain-containing protein
VTLLTRINLALVTAFVIGVGISSAIAHSILQENAKREGLATARLMLASAMASRDYTKTEITPLLSVHGSKVFLPQTVPAYAATQTLARLRNDRPEYTYREATLNPTNPTDRTTDWEADVVNEFRNDKKLEEVSGTRPAATGPSLYLARPIRIPSGDCLVCHSTAGVAPTAMIAKYGSTNGFGWHVDEVVGSQIVSVPLAAALQKADHTFWMFLATLAGVFLLVLALVNVMIRMIVLRPIARMAALSDRVSSGDVSGTQFESTGSDEIAQLGRSFERMRRSLEKSLAMLNS